MGARGAALGAATILIMQRLHEHDLAGHVLETLGDRFVHLCLPMRYEPPAWVDLQSERQLVPRMKPTRADGPAHRGRRAAVARALRPREGYGT